MSYFEYENFNRVLTIREGQVGHTSKKLVGITAKDQSVDAMVMVKAEDAPAVALAILEAAGHGTPNLTLDGVPFQAADDAVMKLRTHIKARAEEAEREAEDTKAREFFNAMNPGSVAHDVELSDEARDQYRTARKFFTEDDDR